MLLVALAVLVAAAIVAALGYMRWQTRRIARDLPSKLGIQIQQSTEGFTYSKTEQGRTVFTLHAANALQYRSGGHAVLHDVRIQIFDPKDGSANTVAGDQFEYDPQTGIVRAAGESHIDLHVAAGSGPGAGAAKDAGAQNTVHVLTQNLVFNQKTDNAVAGGQVAFDLPQGQGQAIGATYDGKKNQLLLESKVVLHVRTQRGWVWINAARALYDQQTSQVYLQSANYAGAGEHASAQNAEFLLRPDNSVENLHAQGQVRYRNMSGESVAADSMVAALDASSRPQQAHFAGNVQMDVRQAQQRTHASAQTGQFDFDAAGHLRQAVLDRAVRMRQDVLGAAAYERTMQARHMVLHFASDRSGALQLQQALATGNAGLRQMNPPAKKIKKNAAEKTVQQMTLLCQRLMAHFAAGNQLERVDGYGATEVETVAADGTVNTSTGDVLTALFTAPAKIHANVHGMNFDSGTLQSAVQQGHVVMRQLTEAQAKFHPVPKRSNGNGMTTVTADRAEYAAADQLVTLTGSPVYQDAQMEMAAQEMQWNRGTGVMTAAGGVQTTLLGGAQSAGLLRGADAPGADGNAATHILAGHAQILQKPQQEADFYGKVRLWQGADVIEAPMLKFLQAQQEVIANGTGNAGAVHGTFVQAQQPGVHAQSAAMPVNVTGDNLLYSDAEHKVHWTGKVTLDMQTGQMQADTMDLYLQPAAGESAESKNSAKTGVFAGQSSVERFVAQGHVLLLQPGRKGTGERIVYTASDGHFVLTGTEKQPPHLVDATQGSLTGRALVFASEQNTVRVLGGQQPTTAVTRVQK